MLKNPKNYAAGPPLFFTVSTLVAGKIEPRRILEIRSSEWAMALREWPDLDRAFVQLGKKKTKWKPQMKPKQQNQSQPQPSRKPKQTIKTKIWPQNPDENQIKPTPIETQMRKPRAR